MYTASAAQRGVGNASAPEPGDLCRQHQLEYTLMQARRSLAALVCMALVGSVALAQDPATSAAVALMDKMPGQWVMTGTISNKATTDDVDVDWVLNRQYIRIHELSRDNGAGGGIGYEAWVYLVWDAKKGEYAVLWLDNTAATHFEPEGIGHAKPDGDRIPIVINDVDGAAIHTTFAFDRATDRWTWAIDNVDKSGKASPFARLTLTRKK
jgi:hypothetical protein